MTYVPDPSAKNPRGRPLRVERDATDPARCPRCGSPNAVIGDGASGEGSATGFLPRNCRGPRPGGSVGLDEALSACASCGLVWSTIDPARLRAYVEAHGEELARQQWDEFDCGPYRDLPDTDLGREIGDLLAEIDAMIRAWKPGSIGRYRELRGVTWDRAIKEHGDWARLTREEKLALLGWIPKKKPPVDDLDSPFP